jgi:hypothetical protein
MINSVRLLALGLVLAIAWPASAVCPPDCPVGGRRLKMGARRNLRLTLQTDATAASAFPPNGSAGDPTLHGATLRLFTEVGDQFDVTYQLPRDNWFHVGNVGNNAGYTYRDLTSVNGPIKLVLVRPGDATKVKGGGGELAFSLLTNPNPVQAVLTFGSSTQLCMSFGGLAKFIPNVAYKSIRAPAPGSCPASPSAAFLDVE